MATSSERMGIGLKDLGLLLIPEESSVPQILENLDQEAHAPALPGVLQVAISPEVNALHSSLLRRSRVHARYKDLAGLRRRLLEEGSLSRRELNALLWDQASVESLHRDIWLAGEASLHPRWREALQRFNTNAT
jgi:membrane glycosyltransferase